MMTFEGKQMMDQIEPLPRRLRVAFAAACAQRQLPNYVQTCLANPRGNAKAVTRMLSTLWDGIARNAFDLENLRRDAAFCKTLIPDYEVCFEGIEYAEDAVASLSYALDTSLHDSSEDAMRAARRAYSALNEYIIQHFKVDTNTPGAQSFIDSFPIIQAELARQRTDLADLSAAAVHPGDETAVILRVKRRAEGDAASFFG